MKLKLKEIIKSYKLIKKIAVREYSEGNLHKSLDYIDQATILAQQFNWIYADDELENLIAKISRQIFSDQSVVFTSKEKRVVFYDDFCISFVLALQYLNGLVKNNYTILYITGREISSTSKFANIIDTIKNYPDLTIKVIPQNADKIHRIKELYQSIVEFQPSKLLLHIPSKSISIPVIYGLPEGITKYIINLADQTFWLGAKGINYSLEFRQFGATVSYEKRGLTKNQLLYLPFYPIKDNNSFQGFPEITEGKVVIFSGGDFYKMFDPELTYWNLIKNILLQNSNAIFLFAVKVDNHKTQQFIDDFISENGFENRFIYIGFRSDINEVMKHCDIYMGTCPASGSLMSQLAAVNSKPILQFYFPDTPDDETEAAICHNHNMSISFTDVNAFLNEAKHLIEDIDYRIKKGKEIYSCMLTVNQFEENLSKCLITNNSQVNLKSGLIDYQSLTQRWYWLEYLGFLDTVKYIYSILGAKNCLRNVPLIWVTYHYRRFFKTKLFNFGWYKYKFNLKNQNSSK